MTPWKYLGKLTIKAMNKLTSVLPFTNAYPNQTNHHWGDTPLLAAISAAEVKDALKIIRHNDDNPQYLDAKDKFPHPLGGFAENCALTLSCAKGLHHHHEDLRGVIPIIFGLKMDELPDYYHETEGSLGIYYRTHRHMGEVITTLLDCQLDVNNQDSRGNTALHFAILHRDSQLIDLLLQHHARVDLPNKAGDPPQAMLDKSYDEANQILQQQTGGQYTIMNFPEWEMAGAEINKQLDQFRESNGMVTSTESADLAKKLDTKSREAWDRAKFTTRSIKTNTPDSNMRA